MSKSPLDPTPAAPTAAALSRRTPWTVRPRGAPPRPAAPAPAPRALRRAEIAWLEPDGTVSEAVRGAPVSRQFDDCFSAFGRACMVQTEDGPLAVGDLWPGIRIRTAQGLVPLAWVGSITVLPGQKGAPALYRVPADSLGLGRPMPDLMLGAGARMVGRALDQGGQPALTPISIMADGMSVIEVTPASPVRLYHLGFAQHCILEVNGVEVDSMHPGRIDTDAAGGDLFGLLATLFPHVDHAAGFGPLVMPRTAHPDAESFAA